MNKFLLPIFLLIFNYIQIRAGWGTPPPSKVGQCSNTFVQEVTSRFGARVSEFGSDDSILILTNGLGLYLYQKLRQQNHPGWGISEQSGQISLSQALEMFQPNDKVKICLEYIPIDCPERISLNDRRGEIYYISNYQNNRTAFGHFGRNSCGGA